MQEYVMHSKVAGVTFGNRQETIKKIKKDDKLELEHEPSNPFDSCAILVKWNGEPIGYLIRELARDVFAGIEKGIKYKCNVTEITGGMKDKPTMGVNILLKAEK